MSRSALLVFSLALALGLGVVQQLPLAAVTSACVLGGISIFRTRKWALWFVFLFGVGFGLLRASAAERRVAAGWPTAEQITGTVVAEKSGSVWLGQVQCDQRPCPTGLIFPITKELGSRWRGQCQFASLPGTSHWSWWSHGVVATCIPVGHWTSGRRTWFGQLLGIRARITSGVGILLNSHEAGLLNGIVLGDTAAMPSDTNIDFRRTGTSHIVALSGFNVTIILNALVVTLMPLVGKRWTILLGLGLVVIFVVMTGASSSVVRAAVMAAFLQGGRLFGRPLHPDRVLLYAISGMAMVNPWVLWHDVGFQLSVTSTFGLLRVRPALERFGQWLPTSWEIRDNVLSTVAATLASGPLLMTTFGQWSFVSVLSNTIVLPFIPIIMALGAAMTPLLWLPTSVLRVLIAPTELLLSFVLSVLHHMAAWPWAATLVAPAVQAVAIFFFLFFVSWAYVQTNRLDTARE